MDSNSSSNTSGIQYLQRRARNGGGRSSRARRHGRQISAHPSGRKCWYHDGPISKRKPSHSQVRDRPPSSECRSTIVTSYLHSAATSDWRACRSHASDLPAVSERTCCGEPRVPTTDDDDLLLRGGAHGLRLQHGRKRLMRLGSPGSLARMGLRLQRGPQAFVVPR
jgi:hypothetical protein